LRLCYILHITLVKLAKDIDRFSFDWASNKRSIGQMKTQWQKIWVKAIAWLVVEIVLNLVGLDNLADYSEFIFEKEAAIAKLQPQATISLLSTRSQFDLPSLVSTQLPILSLN
jgi:hypothetical protein